MQLAHVSLHTVPVAPSARVQGHPLRDVDRRYLPDSRCSLAQIDLFVYMTINLSVWIHANMGGLVRQCDNAIVYVHEGTGPVSLF